MLLPCRNTDTLIASCRDLKFWRFSNTWSFIIFWLRKFDRQWSKVKMEHGYWIDFTAVFSFTWHSKLWLRFAYKDQRRMHIYIYFINVSEESFNIWADLLREHDSWSVGLFEVRNFDSWSIITSWSLWAAKIVDWFSKNHHPSIIDCSWFMKTDP